MLVRFTSSCLAVALAVLTFCGPVSAETLLTRDATGDVEHWESSTQKASLRSTKIDILRMRVRYEDGRLVVRTRFRDLTRHNTAYNTTSTKTDSLHTYLLDTDLSRRGYEYRVDAGMKSLDRLRRGGHRYVPCPGLAWRADVSTDASTLVVPRSCLREGERRVVRTRFTVEQYGPGRTPAGDGHQYVDYMTDTVVGGPVRHG